ncbi:MAG: bifunctional aspartate kinase/diaminopimelate decarboxylase [Deltaproteobacteria bacterium]|nr:bifunctional aspartate kinase/diaminopimelate decarboxylase [Deltaproteobacteria bacterium]
MSVSSVRFVVLKFGGTSVATAERWRTILEQARERIEREGLKPVVVCSAVSKMTDLLGRLVGEATIGRHAPLLSKVRELHAELARGLGVDLEAAAGAELAELERLALGAGLLRDGGPRVRAQIMAMGEILSTRLGAAFLAREGLPTAWLDARTCLVSEAEENRSEAHRLLNATVSDEADPALAERLAKLPEPCVLTQGFLASDREGQTVLLGRGGSDTSAAYFAAKLGAVRCEIWTDVPGLFTADPRLIPAALLVRQASYGEAQEIASMGAKVLHPRCIAPCRRHRIPMEIRWTNRPRAEGTHIVGGEKAGSGQVKALTHKKGVLLVSMETQGMWQQVGFLANVFACFKARGLSVDLVSTSEMNVTASLDGSANMLDDATLEGLLADLSKHCRARLIRSCAAVSLVGRHLRALLPRLGSALAAFEDQPIHLVSQAASDLNLTFVVDEDQADRLVRELHGRLFDAKKLAEETFGPSWRELLAEQGPTPWLPANRPAWWKERREQLLALAHERGPIYVLDPDSVTEAAAALQGLPVERVLYAMKANPHPGLLRLVESRGLGFDCVSPGELDRVLELFPRLDRARLLFTPNFAPRHEYERALATGATVTVDNLFILERWGELLAGKEIFLRVDPGAGRGHHDHVRTAGPQAKFGIALADLERAAALAQRAGTKVVGLHSHLGSGILEPQSWAQEALTLAEAATRRFPGVRVLDLGGGLGVPETPSQSALDLKAMGQSLAAVRAAHPSYQLWIEPGRFLVARAGVLLARVTQLKTKGEVSFVGLETGMNSLLRPALYGAHHEIVNLTRLEAPAAVTAHVVGPICESGDVLGRSRRLPACEEGDVLLIGTTGAYGRAMASSYNLREPAPEVLLDAYRPASAARGSPGQVAKVSTSSGT